MFLIDWIRRKPEASKKKVRISTECESWIEAVPLLLLFTRIAGASFSHPRELGKLIKEEACSPWDANQMLQWLQRAWESARVGDGPQTQRIEFAWGTPTEQEPGWSLRWLCSDGTVLGFHSWAASSRYGFPPRWGMSVEGLPIPVRDLGFLADKSGVTNWRAEAVLGWSYASTSERYGNADAAVRAALAQHRAA